MRPPDAKPGFRFDLTVPAPLFGFDPLSMALGAPVETVLESLLREPPVTLPNGQRVFRCELPEGERATWPLRQFGVLGFGVTGGRLVIYVPGSVAPQLRTALVARQSYAGEEETRVDGSPATAVYTELAPGKAAVWPFGPLGAFGIQKVG